MKYTITIFTIVIFVATVLVPEVHAQEASEDASAPQFLVMDQNRCPSENMEQLMELFESDLAPALRDMEDEGKISTWGLLTHAWGDEYNLNFYVITDDHADFVDAVESLGAGVEERNPEGLQEFRALCDAHKDNMYHHQRPGESEQLEGQ